MKSKALLFALIISTCGCSTALSDKQSKYLADTAKEYYSAPNTAELIVVESTNANGRIVIENFNRVVLNTPVPPKNLIPQEPSFFNSLFDFGKTAVPWMFMGYGVQKGVLK